jgi:hypothetical protein
VNETFYVIHCWACFNIPLVQLNSTDYCSGLHYRVVTVFRGSLSSAHNCFVPGDRFFFIRVKPGKVEWCRIELSVLNSDVRGATARWNPLSVLLIYNVNKLLIFVLETMVIVSVKFGVKTLDVLLIYPYLILFTLFYTNCEYCGLRISLLRHSNIPATKFWWMCI